MNRKTFLRNSFVGTIFTGFAPLLSSAPSLTEPDQIDIKIVKEFVSAGHKDLPLVKEMLEAYPNLIYASYDWGNSDYEEAIEGAAHLGKRNIANFLISKGARVNLFTLTMLGKTDLVKLTLETYPELLFAKGPHGFTMLHHANVGEAKELQEYFKVKGLNETFIGIK